MNHCKKLLLIVTACVVATGTCFAEIQQGDPGLTKALAAVEQAQQAGDKGFQSDALYNVGLRYVALGQWTQAEEYLRKAVDIERTLNRHLTKSELLSGKQDPKPLLRDLNTLGAVLVKHNRSEEAIAVFNEAIDAVKKRPGDEDRSGDLSLLSNQLAVALRQAGHMDEAKQMF